MILLNEVANKIQNILNGTDSETSTFSRGLDYQFQVATQGYHLDNIIDTNTGKNFIPVFLNSLGGQYDAVRGIKRATYTTQVTIYFPVRFKNDFYALNDYLVDCFVEQQLNYGTVTGVCLSNISVASYGEIQDLDLNEFITWVGSVYRKKVDIMEPYMTMQFTLYLTTSNASFIYGNNVKYTLQFDTGAIDESITTRTGNVAIKRYRNEQSDTRSLATIQYGTESAIFYRSQTDDTEIAGETAYAFKSTIDTIIYTKTTEITADETKVYNNIGTELGTVTVYIRPLSMYAWVGTPLSTRWTLSAKPTTSDKAYKDTKLNSYDQITSVDITTTYSEELVWTSTGTGMSNSPISQQLIDNEPYYTTNYINITNYSSSILAYVKNSPLWNELLDKYNNHAINEIRNLKLTKTYVISGVSKTYQFNQVILSLNENIARGELLSFTIGFADTESEE